ncbi:hypothetical protein AAVH_19419 [Aphelenchoides avenae]|nr:hypothetical protein AAVH_19419 [Aphelenchus avenae]
MEDPKVLSIAPTPAQLAKPRLERITQIRCNCVKLTYGLCILPVNVINWLIYFVWNHSVQPVFGFYNLSAIDINWLVYFVFNLCIKLGFGLFSLSVVDFSWLAFYKIFIAFIRDCENSVIADKSLTQTHKFVMIAFKLKRLCKLHADIKMKLAHKLIADWGSVLDIFDVAVDILSGSVGSVIVLDNKGECDLFTALRKAAKGNAQREAAVKQLVVDIRNLRKSVLSFEAQLAFIFNKFNSFFTQHASWKTFFLDIDIEGFGTLEQFLDVCQVYQRIQTFSVVLNGPPSHCTFIKALQAAGKNAHLSMSKRAQINQMEAKFVKFFQSESTVRVRLEFVSAQCFQFFRLAPFIVADVEAIQLGNWGTIRDLLFCASFSSSHEVGHSTTASTTKMTTSGGITKSSMKSSSHTSSRTSPTSRKASLTTKKPSSTSKKPTATTKKPTTTSPSSCMRRGELITVRKACNCTIFTDSINAAYAKFPHDDKANFASYKKRIEHACFTNQIPTIPKKLKEIATVINGCAPVGSHTHRLVMDIQISSFGKMKHFVDCQNASSG